ncbi:MAG: rubrerythrin family protein [Candidatus Altiarchaeales archaeon]|nr:rubrerythrin family protein [Candidatus Altiarchaeales archaeon]MBD3416409.1 rubrerythrin family protein [Candidatus Altiarchaeales archaeon]
MVDDSIREDILKAQENEITEYLIYRRLAEATSDRKNSELLRRIGEDELAHYEFWRDHSGEDVKPDTFKVWRYTMAAKLLGLTFAVKLMEQGEERAQIAYDDISKHIPEAARIIEEEDEHEGQLLGMLDEERLRYMGSVVLGLNDALVELTGALAGFTLAFQDSRLVAVTGLIMGFAASLSMAASEYLATKSEDDGKHPVKASVYTGSAYVLTVALLILPYLALTNIYLSLAFTLVNAILVIAFFTFYISVAKDLSFRERFLEMAGISMGVALLTFIIGYAVRSVFGVDF